MTFRLSPTVIYTGVEATAQTTHRTSVGTDHLNVAQEPRVVVSALQMYTLNNEQSTAIGGSAASEFVPLWAIAHLEAVGGAGATGDAQITIGTSAGGTQILGATALTTLKDLNDRFVISLNGLTDTIPANSTIYVKVTTKDTSAGVGHLIDVYLLGETFVSGT